MAPFRVDPATSRVTSKRGIVVVVRGGAMKKGDRHGGAQRQVQGGLPV